MFNAGMVRPGSKVWIPVNTFDSNDPSASVTATDWANTDCHIHKDGGTTQRASSAGETLSLNFDSITGNHLLEIDTADNTTANFYEAGSTYHVRIEGVTVDAGTINAWIGTFSIGYPAAILNTTIATLAGQTSFTLEEGSADNDAYNGCVAVVHDLASAVQVAIGYVSDYTGATKTVTLYADPGIFTMAAGDSISLFVPANVAAVSGKAQTAGDIYSDTTIISSDTVVIESSVQVAESNTVVIESDTIVIESSVQVTESNTVVLESDSIIIESSVQAVETDTGNIYSDTTIIASDIVVIDAIAWYPKYSGPRGPGVYLNDAAANTNTTNGTDGTVNNPVSTIAAAKTIADSLSLDRIYIVNDSAITLGATMNDYEFVGVGAVDGNTLALNSQDVNGSAFYNLTVTGVQGGTTRVEYTDCVFGTATIHAHARHCGFTDASTGLTLSNNDDNVFDNCYSMVAGNSAPIFICSAANLDLSIRHYSGGLQFNTLNPTATISLETDGQVIFNADCNVGAAVTMRGNLTITDNTAGMSALTTGAVYDKRAVITTIASDIVIIDSGVDVIQSDTVVIESSVQVAESNTVVLESDSIIIESSVQVAESNTVVLESDSIIVESSVQAVETTATNIYSDTTIIYSDTTIIYSDTTAIHSDTTIVASDVVILDSSITVIQSDTTRLELGVITGVAQTGTLSTTQATTNLSGYLDDELIGRVIVFTGGQAAGQASDITDYANASGLVTFTAIPTAPANNDTFKIV